MLRAVKHIKCCQLHAGTAHDLPLKVEGFPTMFFFNKDRGATMMEDVAEYKGDRDLMSLLSFVVTQTVGADALPKNKESEKKMPFARTEL